MKTIKADPTIIITGWFRKRYWVVVPDTATVYELPVMSVKDQMKGKKPDVDAKG